MAILVAEGRPRDRRVRRRPGEPGGNAGESVARAYEAHHGALLRLARGALRDPAAAEDVVQEAFLRLVVEIDAGRAPINAAAWLFRVTLNAARDRGRRQRSAQRAGARLMAMPDAVRTVEETAIVRERLAHVYVALQDAPRDVRVGVTLAAQGYSGAEVARAIRRSDAATRTLLCRARKRLQPTGER